MAETRQPGRDHSTAVSSSSVQPSHPPPPPKTAGRVNLAVKRGCEDSVDVLKIFDNDHPAEDSDPAKLLLQSIDLKDEFAPSFFDNEEDDEPPSMVPPVFRGFPPRSTAHRSLNGQHAFQDWFKHPTQRPLELVHVISHYRSLHAHWLTALRAGSSVLLQGLGHKAPLLGRFSGTPFFRRPNVLCVFVDGQHPSVSVRLILHAIKRSAPALESELRGSPENQIKALADFLTNPKRQLKIKGRLKRCLSSSFNDDEGSESDPEPEPGTAEVAPAAPPVAPFPVFNSSGRPKRDIKPIDFYKAGITAFNPTPVESDPEPKPPNDDPFDLRNMTWADREARGALHQETEKRSDDALDEHPGGIKTKGKLDGDWTRGPPLILLCVSSLDHDALRGPATQSLLTALSRIPRVWYLVTLDKVESQGIIQSADTGFVCYHTPTFLPFPPGYRSSKAGSNPSVAVDVDADDGADPTTSPMDNIARVLTCVTDRSVKILRLIVDHYDQFKTPMPMQTLHREAKSRMFAAGQKEVTNLLKECVDHHIVTQVKEDSQDVIRIQNLAGLREALATKRC